VRTCVHEVPGAEDSGLAHQSFLDQIVYCFISQPFPGSGLCGFPITNLPIQCYIQTWNLWHKVRGYIECSLKDYNELGLLHPLTPQSPGKTDALSFSRPVLGKAAYSFIPRDPRGDIRDPGHSAVNLTTLTMTFGGERHLKDLE
jgi:hypothetical protein